MQGVHTSANEKASMVTLEERSRIFHALSDPTRLQIVEVLAQCGEMTGKDLAERLGITMALLCHHSSTLQQAGLVTKRKQGQSGYNRLNHDVLHECLESLLQSCPRQACEPVLDGSA